MYLKVISLLFLIHKVFSDEIVLNCDNIRELVDGHNDRRLKLAKGEVEYQPPASDMQYLVWDHELEDKAINWALHYTTDHESDEALSSDRFKINQNTFKLITSDEDYKVVIDDVLDSWFNENNKYTYGPSTTYEDDFGDYLRMAQSKAKYVGCGISKTDEDGWKAFYIVCNYGPSNDEYKSQEPYTTGEPVDQLQYDPEEYEHRYGYTCN